MSQDQIDILTRALHREKQARKQAELILESKSKELYLITQQLRESNERLEELVSESSSELKGVFDNLVDAYVLMDLKGNVVKMNNSAVELFGYDLTKESLNVTSLIYKEDYVYAMQAFSQLVKEGKFKDYVARVYTKNNDVRLVHINSSVIFDKHNKPIGAQGIVSDITKEKEAEDNLLESKNRLATLILNLDTGILLEDENRKIVLTNKKMCNLFSILISPDDLIGSDCVSAMEESKVLFDNQDEFIFRVNEILADKKMVIGDVLTMKNGTILERDYIPILTGNTYKGHMWSYRDVTLKRNYRDSLEAQKQKYSNIIANMNLGLMEVNKKDEILMVNQSFERMSGYEEKELIGKNGGEVFLLKEDMVLLNKNNDLRVKGESSSYEVRAKKKNGEIRYWLISGAPNYDINGNVVGSIGIHLDITELKKLQHQKESLLVDLERSNEELQEYAHVVSHDLKSPLRSIYALVSWLKEDNQEKFDESSNKNITLIESSLEKMEALISDILNYSSVTFKSKGENKLDLNKLIEELREILIIPENIRLSSVKKLPTIKGDRTRFLQLFQNLIGNAILYTDKPDGRIEIDYTEDSEYYQFSIQDNGIGIKKEYHEKIFKIFHSLEERKGSSGIGLSIVKKIVTFNGGRIWLESEVGKGTTFYFTIKKR